MTRPRLRRAGDAAVFVEFEPVIAPDVNARVIALAQRVRDTQLEGVRDVVSTYRSVAVHIDPFVTDVERIELALRDVVESVGDHESGSTAAGSAIEIPVTYGGEAGPDLHDLATCAGLTPDEVIARHAGREYRVYMLGFMPGFPYMGTVDTAIAAPRRATPRVRVAAGSVGIAGAQTGVYPIDSPGGWQIIGATFRRLFDPRLARPALCMPGDRVRFVQTASTAPAVAATPEKLEPPRGASAAVAATIVRPGLLTTVQDEGRWGHQTLGVPVAGAMDRLAHHEANALVGNATDAATLEATMLGPELRFERASTMAVAGADLSATLDGRAVPPGTAATCAPGSVLRFGARRYGARAFIAIAGGWDVPDVLGSRATHVRSAMGGVGGRPLKAGDQLRSGAPMFTSGGVRSRAPAVRAAAGPVTLRVLSGPHDEWFPGEALDLLTTSVFAIDSQSDRMGYRLSGGPVLPREPAEMISEATVAGGLQVPPSGAPILLMADRQTTGGYPMLAVVITADLPLAGQLLPGDEVTFRLCTVTEARTALAGDPRWRT